MINLIDFQSGRFCKINKFSLKINASEMSQDILPAHSRLFEQQVVKTLSVYPYEITYCCKVQTSVQINPFTVQQIPENGISGQ